MTSIRGKSMSRILKPVFVAVVLLASVQSIAPAQSGTQPTINIYGFVMLDAGYNFNQINPNWTDVVRPTKLPSFKDQYAPDGNMFFGVRQTRLGVKGNVPTPIGELKTTFEFELFGTGVDEGQTTFRLRHAYGELGHFGAGQTWSPFMDIDVFPNSLEYWGPTGMVFFRNLQVRWMPIQGDTRMTIALERPGASADQGTYAGRIELQDVKPRFPYPDLSAEYHLGRKWGYVELAGMVRRIEWQDQGTDAFALSGNATGWGLNLSSNLNLGKSSVARLQAMYGEGVENYMNDAPADIGIENQPGNPVAPIKGVALPVTGVVAFLDHTWNTKFTTAIGYSMVDIDNSAQQSANAFSKAQYALGNLLYSPTPGVTAGVEFQWGNRDNFSDGFTSDIRKIQFSFKYAFAKTY
jgi:DcaP outer membrane protein